MNRVIKRMFLALLAVVLLAGASVTALMFYQGRIEPSGNPEYVALGSSFAAGLGLGERAGNSPLACQRSINGYPQVLARTADLSLVDMTCSGSTAKQVLEGGQFFQGPQLSAVRPTTRLVTLTTGGNDISYIGDLIAMGYRNRGGFTGWVVGLVMQAPHTPAERDIGQVKINIQTAVALVRQRAPSVHVVVVTYPAVLPEQGTCAALNLTQEQVELMRPVAAELANATRAAALASGATLVDMAAMSVGHDACSSEPWVNGLAPASGAAFHPTLAGTTATAHEISKVVGLNAR
jgi:lysophospholipase L1-like esterase